MYKKVTFVNLGCLSESIFSFQGVPKPLVCFLFLFLTKECSCTQVCLPTHELLFFVTFSLSSNQMQSKDPRVLSLSLSVWIYICLSVTDFVKKSTTHLYY